MSEGLLDKTELDFRTVGRAPGESGNTTALQSGPPRLKFTVTNTGSDAILHVGMAPPAPWLELYPAQFALAPGQHQSVTAELRPNSSGVEGMLASDLTIYAQFFTIQGGRAVPEPGEIAHLLRVIPPHSACPNCGSDLGRQGAQIDGTIAECRQCGERIRLCPICGTPNTWKARVCLSNPAHVLRTQLDWQSTPGGSSDHALVSSQRVGSHLARVWSMPSFPSTRVNNVLEWSAPIVSYGIVAAAFLDPTRDSAFLSGFEAATGVPLWEIELGDDSGVYPDRGGLSLAGDMVYAATVAGTVTAVDIIRGVRRWQVKTEPGVYGGVCATETDVVVPANGSLYILNAQNGESRGVLPLKGKINAAPAVAGEHAYAVSDDCVVSAFSLDEGRLLWSASTDAPFDASPMVYNGMVICLTTAGTAYAFKAETGEQLWTANMGSRGTAASPVVTSLNLMALAGEDGAVHLLDPATGHTVRSKRITNSPLRCTPASSGGSLFLGADDGSFYSMDPDFNAMRAYETTPGSRIVSAGLALYGDLLFGTSTNGLLYALRATE